MSMTIRPKRQYSSEIINLESMIPENHFLRVIEKFKPGTMTADGREVVFAFVGAGSVLDKLVAYAKEHNIPLIRIPYTRLNDLCLEDLLLETSTFIIE